MDGRAIFPSPRVVITSCPIYSFMDRPGKRGVSGKKLSRREMGCFVTLKYVSWIPRLFSQKMKYSTCAHSFSQVANLTDRDTTPYVPSLCGIYMV